MSQADDEAPVGRPLRGRVSRAVQRLLDRGKAELDRATQVGRHQLERRQLSSELDAFWIRLGKTAFRLAQAGEIDHPALSRAMVHIQELEDQIERLKHIDDRPAALGRESSG